MTWFHLFWLFGVSWTLSLDSVSATPFLSLKGCWKHISWKEISSTINSSYNGHTEILRTFLSFSIHSITSKESPKICNFWMPKLKANSSTNWSVISSGLLFEDNPKPSLKLSKSMLPRKVTLSFVPWEGFLAFLHQNRPMPQIY